MFDIRLTAEQLEMEEAVRDFAERELKPLALDPTRLQDFDPPLPWAVLEKASQMGLRASMLSEEAGGAGADTLTSCVVLEELAAGDVGVASIVATTTLLGRVLFEELMSPAQRERFLPTFLSDDRYHLALAADDSDTAAGWFYYQPQAAPAGSRVSAVEQCNGDWLVNGVSSLTANAAIAKLIAVHAVTDNQKGAAGSSMLLVPCDTPGVSVEQEEPEAGPPSLLKWHSGAAGRVVFKDCRVPADQLLGRAGEGARIAASPALKRGTAISAAVNLGVGRAAYQAALDYAKIRRQGGRNIVEHEAIGMLLADMAIKLEAARNLVWKSAWALDHPGLRAHPRQPHLPLATMAKVYTSEMVNEVTLEAAECFGAMGVMRDMPLQKYVHDGLVFVHGNVSNSAAKLRISEIVSGYERPSL